MQTVAETPTFTKQADDLFDEEEKQALIAYLSQNPLAGDVISGTGGLQTSICGVWSRQARWGTRDLLLL